VWRKAAEYGLGGEVDIIQSPDMLEVPSFLKCGMGWLYIFLRLDKSDSPELQHLMKALEAFQVIKLCLDICSSIEDFRQVQDVVKSCHEACEIFEVALQTCNTPLKSVHYTAGNFAQWLLSTWSTILSAYFLEFGTSFRLSYDFY